MMLQWTIYTFQVVIHLYWYEFLETTVASTHTLIPAYSDLCSLYRIAGKFGEEINLANWRGIEKITKLKIAKINFKSSHIKMRIT